MFKNKPITLLITAGLVLLLITAAGVYPLAFGNLRGGRLGFSGNGTLPQFQGNGQQPPEGFTPSGGNFPRGDFPNNSQSGSNPNGTRQYPQNGINGNFSGTMASRSGVSFKLLQLLQIVLKAGAVIILVLGILAILGIMLGKDWGRKTAIATAILGILFTAAGFFGFVFGISLWVKLAALVFAVAILVLSFLPKSRIKATVPA